MSKSDSITPVTHQLHIPQFQNLGDMFNFIAKVVSLNTGRREAKLYKALHKTHSFGEIAKMLDHEISDSHISKMIKKYK